MNRKTCVPALVLAAAASGLQAQTMQPGLWEIQTRTQSASGEMEKAMAQMQQQLAAMSPEQRKMMQDMMGKQGVGVGASGVTAKVCLTREMIERNEVAPQQGDCKTTHAPRSGNRMKFTFSCSKPPSNGTGEMTILGPQAFTNTVTVNTTASGRSEQVTMHGQGKWLSAECGAIKPLAAARP